MEFVILGYLIIGLVTAIVHVVLVGRIGYGWSYVGPLNFVLSGLFWPYTIGAWIFYFYSKS